MAEKIKKAKIIFPDPDWHKYIIMSAEMKDFISRLLDRNHETRLGANGSEEVKQHPWFNQFDFKLVEDWWFIAPYIPPPKFTKEELESINPPEFPETVIEEKHIEMILEHAEKLKE